MKPQLVKRMLCILTIFLFIQTHPKIFVNPSTTIGSRQVGIRIGNTLDENRASIGEIVTKSRTINQPGNYILGNDIDGTIVIAEENVWLNLNGYTIFESTGISNGIVIEKGARDITIINGNIDGNQNPPTNGAIGILINEAELVNIENVYVLDFPKGIGISLIGTDSSFPIKGCNIKNCIVSNCKKGIFADHVINSTFANVEAKDCFEYGFLLENSRFNVLHACKALNIYGPSTHAIAGFAFQDSSNNLLKECIAKYIVNTNNIISLATAAGFHFWTNSPNNEIINCHASSMSSNYFAYGIYANDYCTIVNNHIQGLASSYIAAGISATKNCYLEHNTIFNIPADLNTRQRSIDPIEPAPPTTGPEKSYGIYIANGDNIIRNNSINKITWEKPTGTGEAYGIYSDTATNIIDGNTVDNISSGIGIKHHTDDMFIKNISFNNTSDFDPMTRAYDLTTGTTIGPYDNVYQ